MTIVTVLLILLVGAVEAMRYMEKIRTERMYTKFMDTLFDRLMARDFTEFKNAEIATKRAEKEPARPTPIMYDYDHETLQPGE